MEGGRPNMLWRMIAGGTAGLRGRSFAKDEELYKSTQNEDHR